MDRLDGGAATHASGPDGEPQPPADSAMRVLLEPRFACSGGVSAPIGEGLPETLRLQAVGRGEFC